MTSKSLEEIVSPAHYKGVLTIPASRLSSFINADGSLSLQYIEIMEFVMTDEEFQGHLKGQIWKYLLRIGKKDNAVQEASKSNWYLTYFVNWLKKS